MSDTASGTYGQAHGQTNWFRWDPSTALGTVLLVAVAVLFFTGLIKIRLAGGASFAIA